MLSKDGIRDPLLGRDINLEQVKPLVIFVDYCGESTPMIDHAPWNGVRLADFVMPSFDFIVGVSLVMSMQSGRMQNKPTSEKLWLAFSRAAKLFVLGILTQAGTDFPTYDLKYLRVMGILQRVALCYLAAALTEIYAPLQTVAISAECPSSGWAAHREVFYNRRWQWVVSILLVALHAGIVYGVDDGCGAGVTSPHCNGASYVDRLILGKNHMYFPSNGGAREYKEVTFQRTVHCSTCAPGRCVPPPDAPAWCGYDSLDGGHPFDPEGLVSSLTAVVAAIIGTHYGAVAICIRDHAQRLLHWVSLGIVLVMAGLLLDLFGLRFNTDLYSFSYLLLSTGAAMLAHSLCYLLVEGRAARGGNYSAAVPHVLRPFHWLGLNSIVIYMLSCTGITQVILSCVYWGQRDHNLSELLYPTGKYYGPNYGDGYVPEVTHYGQHDSIVVMCWCLCGYIPVWMAVAGYLHRIKWYLKI